MGLIEAFERGHINAFAEVAKTVLPKVSWCTPDKTRWTPQKILHAWGPGRMSDHWAYLILHRWVASNKVEVAHVDLPSPLRFHNPTDEAWRYIEKTYGGGEDSREPEALIGRADLACAGTPTLMVEFGTCAPVKFVLNLGLSDAHWMLVPYECKYAFVFIPVNWPILSNFSRDPEDLF